MRNTVAKRLRRKVYGDLSRRGTTYTGMKHRMYKTRKDKDGKNEMYLKDCYTIVCKGTRRGYLAPEEQREMQEVR